MELNKDKETRQTHKKKDKAGCLTIMLVTKALVNTIKKICSNE